MNKTIKADFMLCRHKDKTNLSPKRGKAHYFCVECGWHYLDGTEYTSKDWQRFMTEQRQGSVN